MFWLNVDPFVPWFAFSPDGKFLAYPGKSDLPGIWVLDLKSKISRLIAPEVLDGKKINSYGVLWSPDSKQFLISRVNKELQQKVEESSSCFMAAYQELGEGEVKRMLELWNSYIEQKGHLQPKDMEDLAQLLEKFKIAVGEEQMKNFWRTVDLYLREQEVRAVDAINGSEAVIFRSASPIGWSIDGKWIYVEELPNKTILRVSANEPAKKEPVSPTGLPSQLFTPFSKNNKWLVNYKRAKGLWLKEIKSGREVEVDNRKIESVEWNWKGDKIVYVAEGKKFFEIWLLRLITLEKKKVFPK